MQKSTKLQKVINNQISLISIFLLNDCDLDNVHSDIIERKRELNINGNSRFNDNAGQMISSDLDAWIGEYKFSESASEPNGPIIIMNYEIEIYKKNNSYYAKIVIDGQTTLVRAKAQAEGSEKFINLRFVEYLPDHRVGMCSEINDVLISFEKNENIYIYWGEIEPMLYKNNVSGNVYFE